MKEMKVIDNEPSWTYIVNTILNTDKPISTWEKELRQMAKATDLVRQAQKKGQTLKFSEGKVEEVERARLKK